MIYEIVMLDSDFARLYHCANGTKTINLAVKRHINRFIIIDRKILYHCGVSFKDLGVKCFAVNKINDKECLNKLISRV